MAMDSAQIRTNLDEIGARVRAAAADAGHDVRVLLATKTQPAEAIRIAIEHGFDLIGENRVQELTAKAPELADLPHTTHLIGPLQKNKVNHALRVASCIESIDDRAVAQKIQRRLETVAADPGPEALPGSAASTGTVGVFVQVNTSREDSKSGVAPEQAAELLDEMRQFDRLRVRGLMTIGLPGSSAAQIRPSYADLRELRDSLLADGVLPAGATELSMGMSGDFELAIAEGATLVRVGSAVFGARPQP